jgi:hypothetical protein
VDSEIMSMKEKLIDGLTASFAIVQQNRLEVCDSETCVNRCKEKRKGKRPSPLRPPPTTLPPR